jgi:hypothetical protein
VIINNHYQLRPAYRPIKQTQDYSANVTGKENDLLMTDDEVPSIFMVKEKRENHGKKCQFKTGKHKVSAR